MKLLRVTSLLIFALAGSGCGSDGSDSTTGSRVILHTTAHGDPAATTPFTTGFKWDVTLTKAAVSIAGLYYFDGPPPTTMLLPRPPTPLERLEKVLGLGTAWAHPGHYQAGTARGQTIPASPITLDVLSRNETSFGDGDGITGPYRSARVVLPETPPSDAILGGHIAIVEGSATKSDGSSAQPIYFRLTADWADISESIVNGAVDGCVLDDGKGDGVDVDVESDGNISMEVLPSIWLNLVDFSKIAPGTEDAPTEAKDDGFSQGVTQLSAYYFIFSK